MSVIGTIKFIIMGAKEWILEYFEKPVTTTSEPSELEQANEKIKKLEILHSINAISFENLQREIEQLKAEINRLNEKYDFQTLVKTNERLTKENKELKADALKLIEALKHTWPGEYGQVIMEFNKHFLDQWNKKRGEV